MTKKKSTDDGSERSPKFDALVLEHLDMLYAVAVRLTRNPVEAQDLLQTAMLKAFRFHAKFKEGTYIKAWLLTILRNTFINDYRRKTRSPIVQGLGDVERPTETFPDPEVQIEPRSQKYGDLVELLSDEVRSALESLPDEFKAAVIMADVEDKSYKEIAEAMKCPVGTVMSRLYRGRKLMRAQLGDYAVERHIRKRPAETDAGADSGEDRED